MSNAPEQKNMADLLNDKFVQNYLDSEPKSQLEAKAKQFLNSVVSEKANNLSVSQQDALVSDLSSLFKSMTAAIAKQAIASIRPTLFEKVTVDTIHFMDLPFIDKMEEEKSRNDLMNTFIHTDIQFPDTQVLDIITTMMNSAMIIAWNKLKTSVDLEKEPLTIYNLMAATTEVFMNEAFQVDEIER